MTTVTVKILKNGKLHQKFDCDERDTANTYEKANLIMRRLWNDEDKLSIKVVKKSKV